MTERECRGRFLNVVCFYPAKKSSQENKVFTVSTTEAAEFFLAAIMPGGFSECAQLIFQLRDWSPLRRAAPISLISPFGGGFAALRF